MNFVDTNKENNANIQNLRVMPSVLDQGQASSFNQTSSQGESTLHASINKTSSVSFTKNTIYQNDFTYIFMFRSFLNQMR